MHEHSCFITLTYAEDYVPLDGSLQKRHIQLFLKRFRKAIEKDSVKIRYYGCGEYGEQGDRPHYHICVFGYDFKDKVEYFQKQNYRNKIKSGCKIYMSEELQKYWPYGICVIGELTFESAAYVARYCTKKITGEDAEGYYGGRQPEYAFMSRRPGLGASWWEKYHRDVESLGKVIIRNGLQCKVPKYYDSLMLDFVRKKLKLKRKDDIKSIDPIEFTWERLQVKHELKKRQFNKLNRSIENGGKIVCG